MLLGSTVVSAKEFPPEVIKNMTGTFAKVSGNNGCVKKIIAKLVKESPNYRALKIASAASTGEEWFLGANFFPDHAISSTQLRRCEFWENGVSINCANEDIGEVEVQETTILVDSNFKMNKDGSYDLTSHNIWGREMDKSLHCRYKKMN